VATTVYNGGFGGLMRRTVSGRTVSHIAASYYVVLGASAVVWSGLSPGTAGAAILLRESGTDALSPLIAYYPLTNVTTNGGDLTLSAPASGYLAVSSAA
jgi:hypothetical protein